MPFTNERNKTRTSAVRHRSNLIDDRNNPGVVQHMGAESFNNRRSLRSILRRQLDTTWLRSQTLTHSNASRSILTMNTSRIAPTLALIATLGLLIAAAPPVGNPLVDNLGPRLFKHETWPAPNAVLRSGTLSFTGHSTLGDFVGTTTAVSGGG